MEHTEDLHDLLAMNSLNIVYWFVRISINT
jgi:hypothetical protein